ncbi:glycosyltransferase family A protein [Myxosarcina sp. GI1]|uniref:glycosyltransferase family 2 protein n=1 Tax=Myxosarcina sp. GI1 TaxID=1541065 RepID=UPI00090788CB|nr:glycosyltransferase family A protein [Myxosarcina sp. GI1]
MNSLQVSVIVPTKDRPQMLDRAVQSICSQTTLPAEIIIVDDASVASYPEIIEQLKERSPVPLIYHRNSQSSGPGATRNQGAKLASGNVLMFLDDDDLWLPEKIANQLNILTEHPEVGLVYAARSVVDEAGNNLFQITPKLAGQIYSQMLQKNHVGVTSSVAVRKDLFLEAGGFDPEIAVREDYELWIRLSKVTKIAFDPQATVLWTVHSQPRKQTSSKPEIYEAAVEKILQKYQQDLKSLPSKQARQAIASHYTLIADKYLLSGSPRRYRYVLRSLLQYPSVAALARLLPYTLYLRLRKNYSN